MSRSKVEKSAKKGSLAYVQKRVNSISRRVSQPMPVLLYLIFVSLNTAISGKLTIIVKYSTFRQFSFKKIGVRKAYLLLLSYM